MDYREYKKASERHLDTCLSLRELIESKYEGRTLKPSLELEKQEHLFNLYYLCGYIIECRLNYAILKFINFDRISKINNLNGDCKRLRFSHTNNTYKVSFSHKETNSKFALWQPAHKFQSNIHFFAIDGKLSGIDHIRGINGLQIKPSVVNQLFYGWDVEYRYETKNQNLNSSDIFEFLSFANEVLIGLEDLGY